ncbi:MAG: hypothetical protein AVDCRST_MAG58-2522 [uncultured Rubrobacteraceae bacterium]|uniref:Uncharacterized protein n=1 Tax=uncultured Rubrobacteraceae bacterium TaxID=349277 RepID=A0A6J4R8Z8_9ACTN|nr:MAG: hypothetical protein AVDCRST_MAG58-2522 [uncultured Rubrobacteraceae bacterium]
MVGAEAVYFSTIAVAMSVEPYRRGQQLPSRPRARPEQKS